MIILFITAMIMGGLGSLHCIGMCGPLALSLPMHGMSMASRLPGTLLYNMGRVVTYSLLGALVGLLGASFSIFGLQQWLSIMTGCFILVYLLWPKLAFYKNSHYHIQSMFGKIRTGLSKLLRQRQYQSLFFIGLLNGLLPCGLVYMALAAALVAGTVAKSSLFMAAFGLGTLPLMWGISFLGNSLSLKARMSIRKIYPYLLFIMACLLIIRGAGLGIPYLSPHQVPAINGHKTTIDCHTYTKQAFY